MARTTSTLVQELLLSDYNGIASLTPFIDSANLVTEQVRVCANKKGIPLSNTNLELIERWLAAHYYVMSDQNFKSEKTGRAEGVYQGATGMRLEASKYGQSALTLDPTGCLNTITSKSTRASLSWLGKKETEQKTYDERN